MNSLPACLPLPFVFTRSLAPPLHDPIQDLPLVLSFPLRAHGTSLPALTLLHLSPPFKDVDVDVVVDLAEEKIASVRRIASNRARPVKG